MAKSDDILKKYGITQVRGSDGSHKNAAPKTTTPKATGVSKADNILTKYGINQVRRSNSGTTQNWYDESVSLLSQAQKYFSDWHSKDDKGYRGLQDQIDSYISQGDYWYKQHSHDKDASSAIGDVLMALNRYSSMTGELRDYYGQWETADDYSSYLDWQKDYDEKSKYDTAAGQKEIDALENELSNLKNGKANLGPYRPVDNSYLGSPYAAAQQSEPASYQAVNTTVNGRPYAAGIHAQYEQLEVDPTDLRISELEKQISQKKQYLNQAKHIQEGITLAGAAHNADFKQYNGYVSTKEDDAWGKLTSQYGMGYADLTYEYINNQNGIRDEINRKHNTYSSNDDESVFEKNGYDYMNANEVAIYNYYYAKEGKEAAEKYLNNIQETLNHRKAAGIFSELEGNTALEMVFGVEAGIDQFKSGMKNLVNFEDDYIAQTAYQIASGMVREDLADDGFKLPEFMGGASIGQVGYDVLTTTANMAPSILASTAIGLLNPTAGAAVGNALMGASAAGNAYQQALNEGFDKDQARGYSILVGASEVFMEKALGGISALGGNTLGKYFTKNIANADSALKMIAKRLGAGMISEFSEEYLQEVLDPFFQNLILKTDHDVELFSPEALYAGILGALSAGVMEGPTAVRTEVKTYGTGKQLNEAGITATRLADIGKTFAADTVAYKLAGKVDENTGAYTMGRLFNEIGATLTEQNKADITNALVAEGMNKEIAEAHAKILEHIFEGGEVSDIQMRFIEKNDILSKVMKDVLIDSNSTVNQRTNGYNDALKALAHEKTSSTGTAAASAENAPASDKVDTKKENGSDESPAPVEEQLKTVAESVVQSNSVGSAVFANDNQRVVADSYADLASTTDNQVIVNMDEQSRNKLVAAYDPSTGMIPKVYVTGSNEAFYYGFEGIPLESMSKSSIAMSLSDKQRSFAYNLGVEAAARSVDTQSSAMEAAYSKAKEVLAGKNISNNVKVTAKKKTTGRAILESGIKESSMTRQQKASYKLADTVAQAVGTNIHVYSGMTEYGKYDENTGEIWLNVNANISGQSMMAFTLGHELVHMAKQWSPKKFKAFADYLLGEYGKKGVTIDALIQEQIDNARRNGVYLDPHAAYEEVIADACQRMLLDSDAVQKMATFKEKNPDLADKIMKAIKDFISKVRAYFNGAEPDSVEAQYYKELDDAAKKILENMFVDMVMDAGEHLSTIRNAFGKGTVVEVNEDGEFTLAKGKDATGSKFLYNDYTWERGGRDTLKAALKAEGFSKEDIDAALVIMDGKHELVKDLAKQFPEQNRINQATVTTDLKDGHSVLSALVSNGEYPVNIDLLMVCKKRKAYQRVINRLCETGLIQQATVDALAIAEINKILGKYGFETACLGCFVESRRLRIQEWAQTICKEWNAEVKKRNPNAKAFGFGKVEATLTQDEVMQLIGQLEAGGKKNDQGNLNLGQGSAVKRMGVLLDKVPALRKTLSTEDLITPDGLTRLRSYDSNLFSIVKSRYGSNSPKFVQEFNPYNHELAQYGKVPSEYSSLREYLYAIGGARMQSFSDFIVENWFDYCQIVADLAARKLPMHTYTKEISLAKLFGLTGIKINMSLIPDIDRSLSKDYAGLTRNENGELELIWADKDRFKATGGKSYMQSINFKDAMDLQNDPRYSANVGTIAIGVSDIQIRMMLNDPRIRMVIPYHSSGMNPIFADLMGTSYYKDYTMVQNTTVKQVYDSDGKKVSLDLDKTQTGKLTSGFQFNEVLQELGDARAAADAYKEWCADASKHTITINGKTYTAELTPKFDDFSGETNYYKLLEDFNTYDCISEQAAPQGDVQQIYPENFDKILTDELKAQEGNRQKQAANQAFDKAMGEIESFLKTHTKADTVFYAEQHGVKLGAKDKKLNAADKKKLAELRKGTKNSLPKVNDTEYLDAVKRGDMETAQKMVDEAAKSAGFSTEHLYHGTSFFGFTTIDTSESDDSISFFATTNQDVAQGYMPWYEDDASDIYHEEPRRIGKDRKNRAITNSSSVETVIKTLNHAFDNQYKNARAATDKETLDSLKLYQIPQMVDAAEELIKSNVPKKIEDLCRLVVEANKKDTFAAWADVSKRYKEFEAAEIPYDPYDWSKDILWARVLVDLQIISKMARTDPIWNDGAVIMKSALVDRYNTYLGGESIGMYDFYGKNDNQMVVWGSGSNWNSIPLGEHDAEYRKWLKETSGNDVPAGRPVRASTRDISAFAKHMGYRSVMFADIYDAGAYGERGVLSDVYSYFYPQEDIKSADPVTYDDSGNVIPLSERFNPENKDIRYSLPKVKPVQPTTNKWKRTLDTDTVKAQFPDLWDVSADESEFRNPTQISGTVKSYRKIYNYLKDEGFNGSILDASSGLGYGTKAGIEEYGFDVEDIEPYPDKSYNPKYTDYSALDKKYDVIISNAVLNVLPQDQRDSLVIKMAELLNPGGRMFINVRGKDVENASSKVAINADLMEYYISQSGSYQKGFKKPELVAYLEDALGEGYRVNPTSMFGAVSAVVTKIGDAKYSNPKTDGMSSRQLLADAFDKLVQTPKERQLMDQYRSNISNVEEVQGRLTKVRGKIKSLTNAGGSKAQIAALNQTAGDLAKLIDSYDRKLLDMEASKPLRNVLERARSDAYQRAKVRGEENLAKYKQRVSERFDRGVENRNKTVVRKKIQNVVKELNDLLLNESKKRHVPDSLKKAVAGALSIVNMDTVGAEERAAKYAALIAKEQAEPEPDQDKIDSYTVSMENILRQGEKMDQRLKDLRDAYEEIHESTDPDIANAYDPGIAGAIKELSASIGDTSLRNMSIEQLSDVYDMYKMVLTRVRDANKAMIESIKENISTLASVVIGEVRATGGEHTYRIAALDPVRKFLWNNLKPVYAMEHIGSATLTKLFNNVRAGEDTWAKDVTEAREYYLDKSKKYGYNSWDFKKKYRFESNSGVPFELTLEQILSLYAYSKRNQAHDHLRLGGFVFDSNIETYTEKGSKLLKYKVNTADAHQITPEILSDIIGKLTPEQMGFVDEMQDYLSTVMGAKGNEVTSKMYGVKLFKEKFYFPLKSAKQFMFEQNEVSGEVKIKNSGFTNKVVAKANNPVILSNFMEVWSGHVNDMSMYHAFVLPLEDFNRVFNYNSPKKDGKAPVSVKGTIQNAYSPAAVSYVKNLITDLNGGARGDYTTGFINKMMGLFKKGSVFASLSVVIQQPSAIARAAALVDTKYFVGAKVDSKRHKLLWEEIKKYAPVAIIKEMGYFDTNMGKSTEDFIMGKEYSGFNEKMKALVTDSDYRDEILSKAPSLADELAWCGIWNAVKREIKDKNPGIDTKSEVFLKKAGERFTEVIIKTQVYDSVLSRSANMRSKDTGMKMATAFMAEPTTSINMIADALLKGKRGNKKYARAAIGAVIASQIFNSILVSFVYAGRDDDEEKSYWEKYIESLTGNVLDSLNPMTYIPFVKDIMSIAQGYDVERSDMAVVSDLWKAWQNLSNDRVPVYRKVEGFAGSIAQIFGLPVKNIMRDVRGIYQTINSFMNGEQTTKAGIGYAVKDALPKWIAGGEASNQDQLYNAYVNGDKDQIARVSGRYDDESAVQSALRKGLRDNDPRVHEAAIAWNANDLDEYMRLAREIIGEKHFSQDDVVMAIRAEASSLAPDEERSTTSKANGLFTADKFAEAIAQGDQAMANSIRSDIIQTDMKNGKTAEEAEKSFESSAKGELKELFMAGTINENRARTALVTFAGMEDEEADLQVQAYSWERQGFAGATMAAVRDYNEHCAVVGVPKDIYLYIRKFSNGKTIYYSAMKRVMDEIDSQNLTDAQKTAIARSLGWSEKNIQKYKPW